MDKHVFWNRALPVFALALVCIVAIATGCVRSDQPAQNTPNGSLSDKPMSELHAQLSISGTPSLDQPVELTLTFFSDIDAPGTVAQIMLPNEFELVSGDITWRGDITKDKVHTISTVIKAVKTGDTTIRGEAISTTSGEKSYYSFGDIDILFISVFTDNATVTHNRPIPPRTEEKTNPM